MATPDANSRHVVHCRPAAPGEKPGHHSGTGGLYDARNRYRRSSTMPFSRPAKNGVTYRDDNRDSRPATPTTDLTVITWNAELKRFVFADTAANRLSKTARHDMRRWQPERSAVPAIRIGATGSTTRRCSATTATACRRRLFRRFRFRSTTCPLRTGSEWRFRVRQPPLGRMVQRTDLRRRFPRAWRSLHGADQRTRFPLCPFSNIEAGSAVYQFGGHRKPTGGRNLVHRVAGFGNINSVDRQVLGRELQRCPAL